MKRKAADKSLFPCQMGLKGKRLLFIYLFYIILHSTQFNISLVSHRYLEKKNQDGFDCFHTKGTYKIEEADASNYLLQAGG